MLKFSERFHVVHHIGEAGDWAVEGMMEPRFKALESAIEHGNSENSMLPWSRLSTCVMIVTQPPAVRLMGLYGIIDHPFSGRKAVF
jgi:hypothetical protein